MTDLRRPGDSPSTEVRAAAASGSVPGARIIDLATPDWCWSRLGGTTEGLLSSRCPRTGGLVVDYTVSDSEIIIPLGADPEPLFLVAGVEVTLGLVGHGEDGQRWVVRVTGTADLSIEPSSALDACRSSHPAQPTAAGHSAALLLPVERLRGYHETWL